MVKEKMENKILVTLAVFSISILLTQVYVNNAYAISILNITYTTGTIIRDVSYDKISQGSNDAVKYTTGLNGSGAVVFKIGTSNTFLANQTLAGSTVGRALEFNHVNNFLYVASNDKIWKLTNNLGIAGSFATGTASTIITLFYDDIDNTMYFCTTDSYGTINLSTLSVTTLYTDGGTNGILGCSFDSINNFAYLSGNGIGNIGEFDIIRVNLNTHVVINGVSLGVDFFQMNCLDDIGFNIWAMEPSNARVRKYDSTLTQLALVTVGTTPRSCSINTDETGRRLYVSNEGTDNISIVDIDSNAIINTIAVCNVVADRYLDTKRLQNTTQTYIPCSANINTILTDDSVSSFIPLPDVNEEFCLIPANFNLLRCVLARGDTTPIIGASETIEESATTLICQIGLIQCTNLVPDNPDIKTNGIGFLLVAISLGIMIGIFWVASRGDLGSIPTFVWFIGTLGIVGAITAIGWIDPTFLVITVIAIIAMAVAKAKGVFNQSDLFKGELS